MEVKLLRKMQERGAALEQRVKSQEETMAKMTNGDTQSETSVSDHADNDNTDDIPTIVVDPVDEGREVS